MKTRKNVIGYKISAVFLAVMMLVCAFSGCIRSGNENGATVSPINTQVISETVTPELSEVNTEAPSVTGEAAVTATETVVTGTADTGTPGPSDEATDEPVSADSATPVTPGPTDPATPVTSGPTDPATPVTSGPTDPATPVTAAPTDPATPVTAAPTDPATPAPTDPVTGEYVGKAGKTYKEIKYVDSEDDLRTIDGILDGIITDGMEMTEQIRQVHDWMVMNLKYDTTFTYYHLCDALEKRCVVCQGYTELFCAFMFELGVPCEFVSGNAGGEAHAWNAVKIEGYWYYVDVTWDDPLMNGHSDYPDGENMRYDYFLVTQAVISEDHHADSALPSPAGTSPGLHDEAEQKRIADSRRREIAKLTESLAGTDENTYYILTDNGDRAACVSAVAAAILNALSDSGWELEFTLYFDSTLFDPSEAVNILKDGIAEARSQRSFGYKSSMSYQTQASTVFWYAVMTISG